MYVPITLKRKCDQLNTLIDFFPFCHNSECQQKCIDLMKMNVQLITKDHTKLTPPLHTTPILPARILLLRLNTVCNNVPFSSLPINIQNNDTSPILNDESGSQLYDEESESSEKEDEQLSLQNTDGNSESSEKEDTIERFQNTNGNSESSEKEERFQNTDGNSESSVKEDTKDSDELDGFNDFETSEGYWEPFENNKRNYLTKRKKQSNKKVSTFFGDL